jgi:hypothetical protein
MPEIVEEMPYIPQKGTKGRKLSMDGHSSESSRMAAKLKALPMGHCITILPDTGGSSDSLERTRVHWSVAASRARLKIVTRIVTTATGDRALRIWRVAETQ